MERAVLEVNGSFQVIIPREFAVARGLRKGQKVDVSLVKEGVLITAKTNRPEVLTIGYEGHTVQSFLKRLTENGVTQLVDVRELPLSRKKGFSRTPLKEALSKAGISYRHVPELGAPKPIRGPFQNGGPVETFRSAYGRHLDKATEFFESLCWTAEKNRTVVMCVERSYLDCHRKVLSDRLEAAGLDVTQLM